MRRDTSKLVTRGLANEGWTSIKPQLSTRFAHHLLMTVAVIALTPVAFAQSSGANGTDPQSFFVLDKPDAGDPETPVWPLWLGEAPAGVPQLKALLAPYPSDEMICWPVRARVGNVKNNDPSLIEPVTPS
jgi:hypothetical protein